MRTYCTSNTVIPCSVGRCRIALLATHDQSITLFSAVILKPLFQITQETTHWAVYCCIMSPILWKAGFPCLHGAQGLSTATLTCLKWISPTQEKTINVTTTLLRIFMLATETSDVLLLLKESGDQADLVQQGLGIEFFCDVAGKEFWGHTHRRILSDSDKIY